MDTGAADPEGRAAWGLGADCSPLSAHVGAEAGPTPVLPVGAGAGAGHL